MDYDILEILGSICSKKISSAFTICNIKVMHTLMYQYLYFNNIIRITLKWVILHNEHFYFWYLKYILMLMLLYFYLKVYFYFSVKVQCCLRVANCHLLPRLFVFGTNIFGLHRGLAFVFRPLLDFGSISRL